MNCDHQNRRVKVLTEGPHYAREDCLDCGRFIRWCKKPETIAREARTIEMLSALKHNNSLSHWEHNFVISLIEQGVKKLSPKQLVLLEEISKAAPREPAGTVDDY